MNILTILNTLVIIGLVVSAMCAVCFEKILSSVLALGATGAFMSLEFLLLQAPDVAIAEASVGAVLSTIIFLVAIRMTTPRGDEK